MDIDPIPRPTTFISPDGLPLLLISIEDFANPNRLKMANLVEIHPHKPDALYSSLYVQTLS